MKKRLDAEEKARKEAEGRRKAAEERYKAYLKKSFKGEVDGHDI
jgi:hypothetical protein